MKHTLLLIVTAILTLGWVGDVFAQVPSASTTRRASLMNSSRVNMFRSGGGLNDDRARLKSESLADKADAGNSSENSDRMMSMLKRNDLATILDDPNVSNMNAFLTVTGALQQAMGIDTDILAPADAAAGGLLISDIDLTDDNQQQAIATIGSTGMYPPRLRFWVDSQELEEMEKPEVVAQMVEADLKRAAELVADINDKFDLPNSAGISLAFDGLTATIQGRVPNPTVYKQVEMYLGFEPGVYEVQNNLVIDSSASAATDHALEAASPVTHSDPAP